MKKSSFMACCLAILGGGPSAFLVVEGNVAEMPSVEKEPTRVAVPRSMNGSEGWRLRPERFDRSSTVASREPKIDRTMFGSHSRYV